MKPLSQCSQQNNNLTSLKKHITETLEVKLLEKGTQKLRVKPWGCSNSSTFKALGRKLGDTHTHTDSLKVEEVFHSVTITSPPPRTHLYIWSHCALLCVFKYSSLCDGFYLGYKVDPDRRDEKEIQEGKEKVKSSSNTCSAPWAETKCYFSRTQALVTIRFKVNHFREHKMNIMFFMSQKLL